MKKIKTADTKAIKIPHMFILIIAIIILAVVLTWIIPAGQYERTTNEAGIKVVIPDQFSYVQKTPAHLWEIPRYIVQGCVAQASLIIMTICAGGAFHVLIKTGAVHSLIAAVVKRFGKMEAVFIPILMLVCALIATTQSVTIFIAFTPIIILMVKAMGFDSITGAAIPILGGAIGFSTGTLNPSSTVIAQTIAELPTYSGIGYRFLCLIVYWVVTSVLLIRYAKKVRTQPILSPMYDLDQLSTDKVNLTALDEQGNLTLRKILCLFSLIIALGLLVFGCINWGWGNNDISMIFIWLSAISGLIAGFSPSTIAEYFVEGAKKLLATALMIGLAKAIANVFAAANVMDTVVHALSIVLNAMPPFLKGVSMFWANLIINIPITSASGQAGAVMPIFSPLADMVGVTRQTAVLSYHLGDGFCNYILPWSTALMGNLAVAGIPYDRWMRFMWRIFLVWIALGSILVFVAQMINFGPF